MDVGLITGAFGIKGEIRVLSLFDEPGRFASCETLDLVHEDGTVETLKIEKARQHKKHALIKFENISDRAVAQNMQGLYLRLSGGPVVLTDDLTEAENAKLFRERLIGVEVFTKSGDRLGVLEEVIRTGANDVYEVSDGDKSVLLPAISDVIIEVDLDSRRMVVDPLPGLL